MVRFLSSMALGPIALASMVLPSMALPTPTSATEPTPSPTPTNHAQWLATPISKSPQFSAMVEAKSPPVAPGDDIHVVYPWDQSTRELPCVQLRQFPPLPEERFYSMEQRDGKTWGQFCILGLSVFTNSSFKMDGKVMVPTFEIDTASDESLLWHFPKRNGEIFIHPDTYPAYTGWEKELDLEFLKERKWNDKFVEEIPKWLKYLGDKWIYDAIQKQKESGNTTISAGLSKAADEPSTATRPKVPDVDLNMMLNNMLKTPGQHCMELYQIQKPPSLELCVREPKPFLNAKTWEINRSSNATLDWCTAKSPEDEQFCFTKADYPWTGWVQTFDEGYRSSQNWLDAFAKDYIPKYIKFINDELLWESSVDTTAPNSTLAYTVGGSNTEGSGNYKRYFGTSRSSRIAKYIPLH